MYTRKEQIASGANLTPLTESERLTKMLAGGGTSILFATLDMSTATLDKTWQEIANANAAYIIMSAEGKTFHMPVVLTTAKNGTYYVVALVAAQSTGEGDVSFESTVYAFKATSADGYPTIAM